MNTWTNLEEIKNDKTLVGLLVRVEGMYVDCEPDTEDMEFRFERGYFRTIYRSVENVVSYAVVSSEEKIEDLPYVSDAETSEREIIAELYVNSKGVRMARPISEDAREILMGA